MIISQFVLIMTEYAGIYLQKQSAEYGQFLNVSDAVDGIKYFYYLLCSFSFKMRIFILRNRSLFTNHNMKVFKRNSTDILVPSYILVSQILVYCYIKQENFSIECVKLNCNFSESFKFHCWLLLLRSFVRLKDHKLSIS